MRTPPKRRTSAASSAATPLAKLASRLRFSAARAIRKAPDLCCSRPEASSEQQVVSPLVSNSSSSSSSSNTSSSSSSCSGGGGGGSCSSVSSSSSCSGKVVQQQEWKDLRSSSMSSATAVAVAAAAASPSSRKRIMVVVDESREAKTALLWALSHVVRKLDILSLLYILHSNASYYYDAEDSRAMVSEKARLRCEEKGCELIASLKSLCSSRQPEVDVEGVVVAGEKGPTIVRQAKKLDVSVLVLGHKKPNLFQRCLRWSTDDELVEYCIQHAHCLTLSVRRNSKHCGGYLINSKWQKNFWLLA